MLKWSKLRGQQWSGSTLPVYHDGKHTSCELPFQQNVFTVLPSQWKVNPGMVLVFEVFLLRGALSPTDRVVSWGKWCFPAPCDAVVVVLILRFWGFAFERFGSN